MSARYDPMGLLTHPLARRLMSKSENEAST
jgi:hypothetical protein